MLFVVVAVVVVVFFVVCRCCRMDASSRNAELEDGVHIVLPVDGGHALISRRNHGSICLLV